MSEGTEGTVAFHVPGLHEPCFTWYKVVGNLNNGKTPLVILHGGPGACHDYLLPLTDLATKASIPLVFYDQLGNGKSTHLADKNGDEAFWTVDLFKSELDNLLRHLGLHSRPIDLYGHSWGGMLAAEWAVTVQKPLLHKLIISNSLASMETWRIGMAALKSKLSEKDQAVLDEAERSGNFESPEYEATMDTFYQRHLCLARPWPPPEVEAALNWFAADPTTYGTMYVAPLSVVGLILSLRLSLQFTDDGYLAVRYGPSELSITGSLRDWTIVSNLHKIEAPTLLVNGTEDEAQDVTMQPFFNNIQRVKWVTMDNASHFAHVDRREQYMQHLLSFLS